MKKFAERYEVNGFSRAARKCSRCFSLLRRIYAAADRDSAAVIAIVDLKDLPTIKEFELFRDYFRSTRLSRRHLLARRTRIRRRYGFIAKGLEIDIVYKRLLVNEYLPIMEEQPALLDAYRAGAICMVNSFRGKLVHKKAIFAVLTNEQYSAIFLMTTSIEAIKAHIPWTRKFREEQTE